jgi:hypothetical protein
VHVPDASDTGGKGCDFRSSMGVRETAGGGTHFRQARAIAHQGNNLLHQSIGGQR